MLVKSILPIVEVSDNLFDTEFKIDLDVVDNIFVSGKFENSEVAEIKVFLLVLIVNTKIIDNRQIAPNIHIL